MAKKFNPFETMSREQLPAFIQYQAEQIEQLKAQNAALEARLEKLEHRLNKNSTNSSKPPSPSRGWSSVRYSTSPQSS
jgi:BMFP domain-containing protein YqiC